MTQGAVKLTLDEVYESTAGTPFPAGEIAALDKVRGSVIRVCHSIYIILHMRNTPSRPLV
jgi:hypothetical protein